MNDLGDLIRMSLHEHTPAVAPDDTLAGLVAATGRRIRRTRTAGVAALALVAVAGLAWGWAALPLLTQQGIAASPTMSQPTPSQPTPSLKATVRDVSRIGDPSQRDHTEFLRNDWRIDPVPPRPIGQAGRPPVWEDPGRRRLQLLHGERRRDVQQHPYRARLPRQSRQGRASALDPMRAVLGTCGARSGLDAREDWRMGSCHTYAVSIMSASPLRTSRR